MFEKLNKINPDVKSSGDGLSKESPWNQNNIWELSPKDEIIGDWIKESIWDDSSQQNNILGSNHLVNDTTEKTTTPLSDETREKLREAGWPDEILDNIKSEEEVQIYLDAGLVPVEVNGRWVLARSDFDPYQVVDPVTGETNLDRMKRGVAPLDKNGRPIELHHIGQKNDSPLAELTKDEHIGGGNNKILHDTKKESEIDRATFQTEKSEHWKARAEQIEQEKNKED